MDRFPVEDIQAICLKPSAEVTQYPRGLRESPPHCPSPSELGTTCECGAHL